MWRKLWRRLTRRHNTRHIWHALAVGGGGAFSTPRLRRDAAIRYVTREGTHALAYVDDDNHIIFYRYR
jgi:hypothetical protein